MLQLNDFSEYVEYLEKHRDIEFTPFIDSITTNLTSFFRENHHFENLKSSIVPELLARKDVGREIRVWSAGCSTGEEPYTIAMTLLETMNGKTSVRPSITATDIDTTVLSRASSGIYEISRLEGMPTAIKKRWFFRGKGERSGLVKVSPELKEIINFKQLNLISDWVIKDRFHVIFCRNVVIYFDRPTKTKLLNKFADHLVDGGYMILGHSESLQGLSDRFETIGKTIYKKR